MNIRRRLCNSRVGEAVSYVAHRLETWDNRGAISSGHFLLMQVGWLPPIRWEYGLPIGTGPKHHSLEATMNQYIGLDISLNDTAISIQQGGKRIWRGKCPSDPGCWQI